MTDRDRTVVGAFLARTRDERDPTLARLIRRAPPSCRSNEGVVLARLAAFAHGLGLSS